MKKVLMIAGAAAVAVLVAAFYAVAKDALYRRRD